MIKPQFKATIFAFLFICFLACNNSPEKQQSYKANAVATVGSATISLSEVDKQIQQQLYDQLYQVYLFRKRSLESIIDQKLLEDFASARHMSVDSLLQGYVTSERINQAVAQYESENKGVVDIKRTLSYVPVTTAEGRELMRQKVTELARNHLVDSLRKTVPINITLQPPQSPQFDKENIETAWLPQTNLKSDKEIVLISDFECSHCREVHKVFSKLIEKYKDKYKFGIVPYGSYTTLYLTACELVKPYNKFWETYDYLMKQPNLLDTAEIVKFVSAQKIDTSLFKKQLQSESVRQSLLKRFQKVKDKGINATPSLLINGKLIYNAFSEEELEKAINGGK
jgi:hypothetical protein